MESIVQIDKQNQVIDRINVHFEQLPRTGDLIRIKGKRLWVDYVCHEFTDGTTKPTVAIIVKDEKELKKPDY